MEDKLNKIISYHDIELEADLNLCVKQAKELKKRIECEVNYIKETQLAQQIDFDNRLSDLETRAGKIIEICRLHICELKGMKMYK